MKKDETGKIIRMEEYQSIQQEIAELRSQLEEMILMRQRLIYDDGKNVEMDYMQQIGHLEYQLLQYQYQAIRARRQAELLQRNFGRTAEIDQEKIERQLDSEFREHRVRLAQWEAALSRAEKRSKQKELSEEETEELYDAYRQILTRLHPELNPNALGNSADILRQTAEFLVRRDLDSMRRAAQMTMEIAKENQENLKGSQLKQRKSQLRESVENVRREIERAEKSFPYNQRALLKNPNAVRAMQRELRGQMSYYKEMCDIYAQRLREYGEQGARS